MGRNTKTRHQRSRTIRSLVAILPLASLVVLGLIGVNLVQGTTKTLQANLVSNTSSCVPFSYVEPNLQTLCPIGTGVNANYYFNVYGTASNPSRSWYLSCNLAYIGSSCGPTPGPANPNRNYLITQIIGTWVEPYIAPNWDLSIWPGVQGGEPLGTSVANLVQAGTSTPDLDNVWAENADNPPMILPLLTPPPGSIIKAILTRIHTSEWNIYLSAVFPNGYTETWDQNEPWTAAQTPATDDVSVTPHIKQTTYGPRNTCPHPFKAAPLLPHQAPSGPQLAT